MTIYILLFAVTMPLFGRLGDMYGYKRTYLIGMSVFAVASLLAPLARGFPALIALRAVQGVGNGPILPAIMAVIGTLFPPGERGRAMGAWALVNSGFHAAGPPLGGILTQYFGWQSIFVSYVPLCFLAVFLVWRLMPDDSKSQRQPFDVIGAITLTAATLTLMFNLRQGPYLGWTSSASLMLWAVCLGLLAAFVVTERRVRQPFVDLTPLLKPTILGSLSDRVHSGFLSVWTAVSDPPVPDRGTGLPGRADGLDSGLPADHHGHRSPRGWEAGRSLWLSTAVPLRHDCDRPGRASFEPPQLSYTVVVHPGLSVTCGHRHGHGPIPCTCGCKPRSVARHPGNRHGSLQSLAFPRWNTRSDHLRACASGCWCRIHT